MNKHIHSANIGGVFSHCLHSFWLFILLISFFLTHTAIAAPSQPTTLTLDLEQVFSLSKKENVLTNIGKMEVAIAQEKVAEIYGKFISPQFRLESYTGIVSGAKGTITDSTGENDDFTDPGLFIKFNLKVVQPLYTFGKYSSAKEASQHNLSMQKAKAQGGSEDLTFDVTRAFLSMVSSQEGAAVGKKLSEQYQKLVKNVERQMQKEDSGIDDSHLLEIRSMFFEIEKQSTSSGVALDQAEMLLKGLLNLGQHTLVIVKPIQIPAFTVADSFLPQCMEYAHLHSLLLQEVESGIVALEYKEKLEKSQRYPDIFLAGGAGFGRAPNRDRIHNPFITDEYNYERLGAVVGLKWDFNFYVNRSKEKKAVIEYMKLVEKKKLAALQIDSKTQKFYILAQRYWKLMSAAAVSLKSARTWIRLESDNMDMGIGDVKRLISAYKKYYALQANEIETQYNYLLTLARLARTMGNMELFLKWENNGQVYIN